MATFQFELPWPPSGNKATRHTRTGGHYKTAASVKFRALVLRTVTGMGIGIHSSQKPLTGPLIVSWLFAPPDRRGYDIDNIRKETADALSQAGVWKDDSCLVIREESFRWADAEPGGKIFVSISQ